jgi:hypothetical protein
VCFPAYAEELAGGGRVGVALEPIPAREELRGAVDVNERDPSPRRGRPK